MPDVSTPDIPLTQAPPNFEENNLKVMQVQKLLSNVAAYNQWANDSVLNWLKTKPEDLLSQEIPSSYSSIIKTLNHIFAVEQFWLSIVAESPMKEAGRYMATTFDVAEIFAGLAETSRQLVEYVRNLDEAALEEVIALDLPWVKGALPRYELIQHTFNHSTYHRGQLTTIARNLGLTDVPMTDYNVYNLSMLKQQVSA
jgi:uncharacterized damage-inducible protein DinB